MLHIRVISPPGQSDAVRELLLAKPGATHVTVLPGVAVQPIGDVVEADVTRESVDGVLSSLRGLGIDRAGGVTLGTIDTTLSDAADAAEQAAPGDPMDAVIWRRAFAAVALVEGRYAQALGSAAQLAINVVGIVVAAVAVLVVSRRTVPRRGSRPLSRVPQLMLVLDTESGV